MRRLQRIMIGIMAFMLFMLPLLEHMGGTVYAAGRGIVVTVAGTGAVGSSGDGGLATSAQLNDPKKVVFDSAGNMYISDQAEHRVRRIDALTGVISTVAGTGVFGHSGDGGPAISAQLANPHALVFDGSGDLYIGGGGTVRKIDMSTGIISTVAGISSGYQYNPGDGGPALSAGIAFIQGLAFDSAGDLYISSSEGRIRKVDMATGIISTVAGNGTSDFSGDGGAATDAQLKVPAGIAIDGSDNLYIADSFNNRIRKVDTSGIISTVAGGGYQGDGSQAVLASLGMPSDVAVDSDGNLLIAATGDSRIRKVDMATGIISSVAGDGRTGYYGDGGPAGSAALRFPEGLAIDSNGYLHIADTYNHVVRRVGPSNNADLYSLNLSEGVLSPAFSSSTTNYTVFMNDSISSVTVTPSVSDSYAAVTVNGESVNSGSASNAISLSLGDAITIVVTAEDGTTKTYTVTRTLLGSNADLSGLALSSGSLSPAFASETISYTADVGNAISSVTVTPTTSDGNATVEVNGTAVPSGSASGVISLNAGSNTITIKGTAQDGATTKTYTVTVTRAAAPVVNEVINTSDEANKSGDASLSGLTLSRGSLSPAFSAGVMSYMAGVDNSVSSITITPTARDSSATVKINGIIVPSGAASGAIALQAGDNRISIEVTAEDGTTMQYIVKITRDSAIIPEPEPAVKGPLLNSNMTNVNQLKKSIQTKLAANPPKPFSDMAKDGWSFKAVTVAQQLGIVAGKPDTSFHGADPVTRAEFAVMVANALDLEAKGDAAEVFIDTKGHWAESKIGALKNIGAIQGDGSGAFMPEALISRAEISAILARLMVFDEQSGPAYFSDTSSSWANDYISQLADTAIVRGMGNGRFFPNNYATREQSVVMILRMLTVCRNVDLQLIDLSM